MLKFADTCNQENMNDKSDAYRFLFGGCKVKNSLNLPVKSWKYLRKLSGLSWENEHSWFSNKHGEFEFSKPDDLGASKVATTSHIINWNSTSEVSFDHDVLRSQMNQKVDLLVSDVNLEGWGYIIDNGRSNFDETNLVNEDAWIFLDEQDHIPHDFEDCYITDTFTKMKETNKSKGLQEYELGSHQICQENSEINTINGLNNTDFISKKSEKVHSFNLRTRNNRRKNDVSRIDSKSSLRWNCFSLGRTCFRGMSNYYKEKFDPILKEWTKDEIQNRV